MRLVNIRGPEDVRVEEGERPELGSRDVVMKIDACGICGSDITFAKYGFQREGGEPWPLGHEAAGTVVAVGDNVADIPVGFRAVINPMGAYDNVIGNGGSEGAFADYLLIRDAELGRHLLPIGDMTAERAALTEPLAVALHGVNQARLADGDKVVVYGAGPIGLGAVFWLKQRGMKDVVSVDLSDQRLAVAKALGADHIINPGREDLAERLRAVHGSAEPMHGASTVGTDAYLDMAGAAILLEKTVGFAKFQARIVLTAIYPQPVPLDLQNVVVREISLTPAVGYPSELPEVIETLQNVDDERIAPYVSHQFPFDDFEAAFATAQRPDSAKVMVTF